VPDVVAIIEVDGELDMASAEHLRVTARREAEEVDAAILNLSRCPFFDSSAMSTLIDVHDELAERGLPVLLVIPPEPSARRRLAAIAGLGLALPIFDSDIDALESLAGEGVPAPAVRRQELSL
jgi:anti-anti-sigma factor